MPIYVGACVPTVDEAETIGDLVRSLDKMCDVIYIADGSDDDATIDAAREAGPVVWFHDRGGLAGAYLGAGARIASPLHVLHIDAGGSHDPADVCPMIDLAEEGFDVVIGSRFCPGGEHRGPWNRRVTSRLASKAMNFISGREIADWTSGFRLYSPRARAVLEAHDFTTTEVARIARFGENDAVVGLGREIRHRAKASLWLDRRVAVVHP